MTSLLHHVLQMSALKFPGKEALVQDHCKITYEDLAKQTTGLAAGLHHLDLQRGDRVGIYLDHTLPQAISIYGISQADGVFVPINSLLMPNQVVHIAVNSQMKGLITDLSKLASLENHLKDIPSLKFIIIVSPQKELPLLPLPTYHFDTLCSMAPKDPFIERNIGKDLAAILYTSGSTGKPKGVMLNHNQILAGSSIVSDYLEITDSDRILALLPFSFDAGLNQLTTAIQQGSTLFMKSFVFAKQIIEILDKKQITALAGVPTLWSLLAQSSELLHRTPLPHLRYITNTGGVMPQPVLSSLRRALPTTMIFLMYGLTEAFRSTYLPPDELDRRPHSIGKAIPNTEILIVNDNGKPCQPGEVGELVHRGPTVSMGYWGEPELTATRLRPHPFLPRELGQHEKVCYSGDLVKMDDEGFLYFVGRRDTMIKSSGFRISPTEIEEILLSSGKLQGAAVIGVSDVILGQKIHAFVVLRRGVTLSPDDLIAFCAQNLPHYMIPKHLEILDEIPKTPNGKVDYHTLQLR